MNKINIIYIVLTLLGTLYVNAQDRVYRTFGTLEVHERMKNSYGPYLQNRKLIESQSTEFRLKYKSDPKKLSMVFHILHNGNIGNVDLEQIESQIEALNRDFQKDKPDIKHKADTLQGFQKKARKVDISFCIAREDKLGKPTPMIYYYPNSPVQWSLNDHLKFPDHGGIAPIHPDQYINIWICDLKGKIGGYAQFPGGPSETDGIVIDYQFFGVSSNNISYYNEGKTLTHLMGNYLNLMEIWGESKCGDDYVYDTPIHNSPNQGCPGYKHVSNCGGETQAEMFMNFMDNTDDACMYMFTLGQKIRMHSVLELSGARNSLVINGGDCAKIQPKDLVNRLVHLRTDKSNYFSFDIIPNPINKRFDLHLNLSKDQNLSIQVLELNGRVLFQLEEDFRSGSHEVEFNSTDWQPGLYQVRLFSNLEPIAKTKKFIVIH